MLLKMMKIMIKQNYKRIFSDLELGTFLDRVRSVQGSQSEAVDELWRELAYINASAFKGYGGLSDTAAAYNARIYAVKEQAIVLLAAHTSDIAASGGVIFVRTAKGIQFSFHVGHALNPLRSPNANREKLKALYFALEKDVEWDGVENSYLYTDIEEYNALREAYKEKKRQDREKSERIHALILAEIQTFFAHHATRRAYGLPVKKSAWQAACAKAQDDCKNYGVHPSTSVSLLLGLHGLRDYVLSERATRAIEQRLPSGWNQYLLPEI